LSKRTHTLIGFMNPFLECVECKELVPYWHDPDRCSCDDRAFNAPCGHALNTQSRCSTWNSVTGCECVDKETHDK
jgi:hypothetical protein